MDFWRSREGTFSSLLSLAGIESFPRRILPPPYHPFSCSRNKVLSIPKFYGAGKEQRRFPSRRSPRSGTAIPENDVMRDSWARVFPFFSGFVAMSKFLSGAGLVPVFHIYVFHFGAACSFRRCQEEELGWIDGHGCIPKPWEAALEQSLLLPREL